MQGTKLAEISVNAIKKGPKWVPAMLNGHVVTAYREQPITLQFQRISITKLLESFKLSKS